MSTQRGAEAESIVCTALLRRGYEVCFPARGLSPAYDMIVRAPDGSIELVQVKRAHTRLRGRKRYLRVSATDSNGHPYSPDDVTKLAVVDADNFRIWLIPRYVLGNRRSVSLTGGKWDQWEI